MSFNTSNLPKGFSWVSATNGSIPPDAVVAGKEKSGDTLYIARVEDGNVIYVGKCSQQIHGAVVARDGREHFFSCYEVLCGRSPQLKWVEKSGALDVSRLEGIPFIGGTDVNGAPFYVARTKVAAPVGHGGVCSVGLQPGKIGDCMKGASVTYNGVEYIGTKYEVLVLGTTMYSWAPSRGGNVPYNAFEAGYENDSRGRLYICRAPFYDNAGQSLQIGKVASHLGGGSFAYGGREVTVRDVEVLVGERNEFRWVSYQGQLDVRRLGGNPLAAGYDADGTALYVARANYNGGLQPGKISVSFRDGIHFSGNQRENSSTNYEVLCFNY